MKTTSTSPWSTLAGRLILTVAAGLGVLVTVLGAVAIGLLSERQERDFVEGSLATAQAIQTLADATADPDDLRDTLSRLESTGQVVDAQLLPLDHSASPASGIGQGGASGFRTVAVTSGGGGGLLVFDFDESTAMERIAATREAVVLGALFLLLAGVATAGWVGVRFGRSLGGIAEFARRLARNEAAQRAPDSSSIAEMRELEAALYAMRAEVEEVTRSMAQQQSILDSTLTGILTISSDGQIQTANIAATEITGYPQPDLHGNMFHRLVVDHDRPAFRSLLTRTDGPGIQDLHLRHRQGHTITARIGLSKVDIHGEQFFTLALQNMADPRELASNQYWASSDPMTGLPNRSALMKYLASSVAFSQRNGTIGAVLFVDFDRFKEINDTLGHSAGDLFLQAAATRFTEALRPQDFVARFAGDEFIVVLNGLGHSEEATRVAHSLLTAFSRPLQVGNDEMFAAMSIGICLFPEHGASVETLLHCADVAMYSAKQSGGDTCVVFSEDDKSARLRKLQLETQLRRALEKGEFYLEYQPIFDLETMLISRFEALLRWDNPQFGKVGPDEFIPLCEINGLIVEIGEWVLATGYRQVCQWQKTYGLSTGISVNVSARQLAAKDVVERLARCVDLERDGRPAVDLEITESGIIDVGPRSVALMNELREAGFSLSIDDFGTGYSSLAYLSQFPVSCLKIDRSFTLALGGQNNSHGIVEAVIAMGRSLGMKVVAEGVQTKAQLTALRDMGCNFGQGFLLGRPLSVETAGALLAIQGAGIATWRDTSLEEA
ncbi:MAG: EAL domain-containing protein [Pseudomonadota bacterium]|nr:EAL domain-containing protein [Pseudomonadota bacterium]